MCARWVFTVGSDTYSDDAISRLEWPAASSTSTSRSRAVSALGHHRLVGHRHRRRPGCPDPPPAHPAARVPPRRRARPRRSRAARRPSTSRLSSSAIASGAHVTEQQDDLRGAGWARSRRTSSTTGRSGSAADHHELGPGAGRPARRPRSRPPPRPGSRSPRPAGCPRRRRATSGWRPRRRRSGTLGASRRIVPVPCAVSTVITPSRVAAASRVAAPHRTSHRDASSTNAGTIRKCGTHAANSIRGRRAPRRPRRLR